jgi:diguanylate cyclase
MNQPMVVPVRGPIGPGKEPGDGAAQLARSALRYLAERRLLPTPDQYVLAWRAVGGKSDAVSRPDPAPLLAEMQSLLKTVTETVPRMVDDEEWARRRFGQFRAVVDGWPAGAAAELPGVIGDELRAMADECSRVLNMRRESVDMMRRVMAQCIEWLRELVDANGQYGDRLHAYADQIKDTADIASLADTMRCMLDDTQSMQGTLDSARRSFTSTVERARRLEDEVERLSGQLSETSAQAFTDALTGLPNRRGLERWFIEMQQRCCVRAEPLSIGILDVDDFKKLNDGLGHLAGDGALRHLAGLLRTRVRPDDLVARYGGEEFVLLLPGARAEDAAEALRRIQRALSAEVFLHSSNRVFLTFSAGVTEAAHDESLESALERADGAMYRAKHLGKNRVCQAMRARSDSGSTLGAG